MGVRYTEVSSTVSLQTKVSCNHNRCLTSSRIETGDGTGSSDGTLREIEVFLAASLQYVCFCTHANTQTSANST